MDFSKENSAQFYMEYLENLFSTQSFNSHLNALIIDESDILFEKDHDNVHLFYLP